MEPQHRGLFAERAAALHARLWQVQEHGYRRIPEICATGGAPLHEDETYAGWCTGMYTGSCVIAYWHG